jgi:hypothetical protein
MKIKEVSFAGYTAATEDRKGDSIICLRAGGTNPTHRPPALHRRVVPGGRSSSDGIYQNVEYDRRNTSMDK